MKSNAIIIILPKEVSKMFLKIHNFLTNVQKATTKGWKLLTRIHDQQPDGDIMLRLNYPLSQNVLGVAKY